MSFSTFQLFYRPQAVAHPATITRSMWMALGWLCLAMLLVFVSPVYAQGIETVVAPGKLIQGHEKIDGECDQCHVKFDRKAQSRQCMACHKEVGADVRNHTGYHGRLTDTTCNTCHTDHKGRAAKIVLLDEKKFDHTTTDYKLKAKHEQVTCEKCHVAGKKHREASHDCYACHKKDDEHKGSLGNKCADCHTEASWKEAKYDHDLTKFPLTGKHTEAKCVDCHKDNHYKETPKNCYACHRKIDDQKGHKGRYGEKCDSCHTTKEWKPSTFKHDTDTKYVLRFKHRDVKCADCHTGHLYKDKLTQDCFSCHKKDDKHKETLGKKCDSCHNEKSWKESPKFDHAKSDFPLKGKHEKVECKECHKSPLFKEAPKDCFSCHEKDDKHKLNLGKDCAQCHVEDDWKRTTGKFDHARTKFPLVNGHAKPAVKCESCHKDLQSMRNTAMTCISCHKKDDKHEGQLGQKCESCHNDKKWTDTKFDHSQSRFPLTGRHILAQCKTCHETRRYKDAPRECVACHIKDDRHKKKFGVNCESCHSTRSWATWTYEHNTRTKFRLEGAHATAACEACHKQPAPAGKLAAPLTTSCVSCHRSDDVHGGSYGQRCDQCHRVDTWKKLKSRAGAAGELPDGKNDSRYARGGSTWKS